MWCWIGRALKAKERGESELDAPTLIFAEAQFFKVSWLALSRVLEDSAANPGAWFYFGLLEFGKLGL